MTKRPRWIVLGSLMAAAGGAAMFATAGTGTVTASAGRGSGTNVVGPTVAQDQPVANAGRIVFARTGDERTLIVTAAPDGSDLRRLTAGRGQSFDPRWSPGGDRIAYAHGRAVWLMRGDGAHKRRLLANAYSPSWAPDGRRLLVNGPVPGRSWLDRFGIFNLRNETVRWYPLGELNGGAFGSDWSWRDDRIVFAGRVNPNASLADTYTVAPNFTGLDQVTHTPRLHETHQRWAPAGAPRLASFVWDFTISDDLPCHKRVEVVDLADNARTRVRCDAESPGWSPDATKLLLARQVREGTFDRDLVKVDLDNNHGTVVVPHTRRFISATGPDWRPPR